MVVHVNPDIAAREEQAVESTAADDVKAIVTRRVKVASKC